MRDKRRVGVSLDGDVFEELERVAKAFNTDRSHIVNMAAREYLLEKFHYAKPHSCEGVMIISYDPARGQEVAEAIEESKSLVVSRSHFHTGDGCCLEILYLKGDSEEIWLLEKRVSHLCDVCRFVPSHRLQ
ncbi:CopG family ribbon-helix-helix protein [Thermofilum pendens]|uniref:Transcriptional regulator, CopG family n=1 Tax=Thermofilum pendens (strain DSM 2475 / Hrk 5) TaxID=368408 RepID=A1RWF4_THEPD|nr:CopG family transcriptional regulator [Thermofilum pendens]ABL77534.1 transcriptional regulator, CopG family [Thermofilum pendens Hrk 5]